jgi:hypothetical protein
MGEPRASFTALAVADGFAGAKSIVSLRCTTLTGLPWKEASIMGGMEVGGVRVYRLLCRRDNIMPGQP